MSTVSSTIEKSVDVAAPIRQVYNQWTQFEEFPHFMQGVEQVIQKGDKHLHWKAEIAGQTKEWDAEIIDQTPDRRIEWRSTTGAENNGVVMFTPTEGGGTRVTALMTYDPEGWTEKLGDFLGFVSSHVEGDLERFKQFIEQRTHATGAWRGEIHGGQVVEKGR